MDALDPATSSLISLHYVVASRRRTKGRDDDYTRRRGRENARDLSLSLSLGLLINRESLIPG